MFPFIQHSAIEIKDKGISSTDYILNAIDNAMNDSRMTLINRSEFTLTYAKTDIFKYPHPRNFLHNVSFEVKTTPSLITVKISSKNWELMAIGLLFFIITMMDDRLKNNELLPIFIFLIVVMLGVKQYLLNRIKSSLLILLNEL